VGALYLGVCRRVSFDSGPPGDRRPTRKPKKAENTVPLVPDQLPAANPLPEPPADAGQQAAGQPISLLQGIVLAVIVVGFAVLSYYSYATPSAKSLGAAVSLAPIVTIGLVLAWRWTHPLVAALIGAAVAVSLYYFWPALKQNYEWADLLQQFTAYVLVALGFIRSLLAGRVPLCVQLANKLHGPLSPVEIKYTTAVTVAWAIFYSALALSVVGRRPPDPPSRVAAPVGQPSCRAAPGAKWLCVDLLKAGAAANRQECPDPSSLA
jgi:uncharacterized membrane protein